MVRSRAHDTLVRRAAPGVREGLRRGAGASKKADTRCELLLRRELWLRGLRYRLHHAALPGRPDVVFMKQRIAIFCDGDFWHGRDLENRLAKLARGNNAQYWIAKVERNVERDRRHTKALEETGWRVLRYWETDVLRRPDEIADEISRLVTDRQRAL
jgi:DNA mismatch endonuclease, patch repair protein